MPYEPHDPEKGCGLLIIIAAVATVVLVVWLVWTVTQ
jgi:hypothetical protein